MTDNLYNRVRYSTMPVRRTHPDRLAAVGTLFGMRPAPVTQCRLLELGCGDASNLIPMAYHLPGSRFVGVDLADEPIAEGRAIAHDLALANLRLDAADLMDAGAALGEFDYIIAHGVYSWVPPPVRDRLLAICGECLAPEGVAFVSYNTLPGRHVRQMFREMLLHHTRGVRDAGEAIEKSRQFLEWLAEVRTMPAAWAAIYESEINDLLGKRADCFYHDDLSEIADPVYFRDFAAHAARHGLQYLGEADLHEMFDPMNRLAWVGDDVLERQQYYDFMQARRFRQTLLCRDHVPLDRNPGPARMEGFLFSAPAYKVEDGRMEGKGGARISVQDPAVERVVAAMGACYPLPVAFDELVPYAGGPEALRDILYALVIGGFADLHVFDFPCEETVNERPAASRLARYQAARAPYVTSVCHGTLELDETARCIVVLLDGTRSPEEAAALMARAPGAPPLEDILAGVSKSLAWMAQVGLLEA